MSNNITLDKKIIENGDVIKTKVNPLLNHYGVILIDDNNKINVIHNTPFKSITIDEIDIFLKNRDFLSIQKTSISGNKEELIKRYELIKDKKYNTFSFDCEHFIEQMTGNKMKTKQFNKYFTFGIILLSLLYILKNK